MYCPVDLHINNHCVLYRLCIHCVVMFFFCKIKGSDNIIIPLEPKQNIEIMMIISKSPLVVFNAVTKNLLGHCISWVINYDVF